MQPTQPQPYDNSQKRLIQVVKVLAVLAVIVLCIFAGIKIYQAVVFRIVSTSPQTNLVATTTPFMKVTFNKTLSNTGVALSSTSGIIKSNSVAGKTLIIYLDYPLKANTRYSINIVSIKSTSGSTINSKSITFTAQNLPYGQMPKAQQKYLVSHQDNYTPVQKDPILASLPYSTLDFSLDSSFPTGKDGQPTLVLQAQLLLAPGVTGAEAATDTAQYKQEVLDYIKSLNLNPDNYTIQYQVVQEQLTGT